MARLRKPTAGPRRAGSRATTRFAQFPAAAFWVMAPHARPPVRSSTSSDRWLPLCDLHQSLSIIHVVIMMLSLLLDSSTSSADWLPLCDLHQRFGITCVVVIIIRLLLDSSTSKARGVP